MALDPTFLKLIVCPKTRQKLSPASYDILETVNKAIAQGVLSNVGGTVVSDSIDGGLMTSDRSLMYPIRHGIPHLLIDEGIVISGDFNV